MTGKHAYLVQLVFTPLGIKYGRPVAVVEEMSSGNEAITTWSMSGYIWSFKGPVTCHCYQARRLLGLGDPYSGVEVGTLDDVSWHML